MTASAVLSIYDALQAIDIPYNGTTVPTLLLEETRDFLSGVVCPVRMLFPYGTHQGGADPGEEFDVLINSRLDIVQWQIEDVLFVRPISEDIGQRTVNRLLVEYCGNYAQVMRENEQLTENSWIMSATMRPTPREYPAGSGSWFFAIECNVTVRETMAYA